MSNLLLFFKFWPFSRKGPITKGIIFSFIETKIQYTYLLIVLGIMVVNYGNLGMIRILYLVFIKKISVVSKRIKIFKFD